VRKQDAYTTNAEGAVKTVQHRRALFKGNSVAELYASI